MLVPGALAGVAAAFAAHPEIQAVAGRAFLATGADIVAEFVHLPGQDGLWDELLFGIPAFCSWFFRRTFLAAIGVLDEGFIVAADRDLLIRAAVAGMQPRLLPFSVCIHGLHAESATLSARPHTITQQLTEHCQIAARLRAEPQTPPSVAERLATWQGYETLQTLRQARGQRAWSAFFGHAWRLVRNWRSYPRLREARRRIAGRRATK